MRNIRLIVAYDGTDLVGYQRQPEERGTTVQGALEAALTKICNEPITIYGASRTDSGVHAKFQVVTFFTEGNIPVENIPRAMIAHMPRSIVVTKAEEIPIDWKPRRKIHGKEYTYTIHNEEIDDPLTQRFHYHVKKPLDIGAMKRGAHELLGTHDFTTLQGSNSTPANPVKTIYAIGIVKVGPKVIISVIGDGFLYHMVRNIAGLLVDVGLHRREPSAIPGYLEAKARKLIGKTAPPQGLCLEEIFFTQERMQEQVEYFSNL